jgi:Pentapeptide repeats (8 copies)
MANPEHLELLRQGVDVWNAWRAKEPFVRPDLRWVDLSGTRLNGANLTEADLSGANLSAANLGRAILSEANFSWALLVETNLVDATLTDCRIYGISAWNVKLSEDTKQRGLVITAPGKPEVSVDDLEVAQFVYLLLHNEKIRRLIDTVGQKGVLLLGRFTEGRIGVLERLREELRKRGYVPIVFNFDKPETKDFTETIRLLAGLSKFVIADVTNPKSAPLELQATVPDVMVPFRPIIEEGEKPFAMLQDLWTATGSSNRSTTPRSMRSLGRWTRRSSDRRRGSLLNSCGGRPRGWAGSMFRTPAQIAGVEADEVASRRPQPLLDYVRCVPMDTPQSTAARPTRQSSALSLRSTRRRAPK